MNSNVDRFLSERVRARSGASVGTSRLFASYESWAKDRGQEPLGLVAFGLEVIRARPELTTKAERWVETGDGQREQVQFESRAWQGIELRPS